MRPRCRHPLPALFILLCVLVAVSCRDAAPRSRWTSAASAWDVDPDALPLQVPTCPQPGAAPDPLPPDLPPGNTVEAGTLPGAFSVSPNGEATYAIPLPTLPGRGAIEPRLSITYNSALGEGPLGVGFSLSGLSAISRCPRTVAQDEQLVPVRDEPGDALCLDGQRLVAVDADSAGLYPSEYRTFPDTFSKIIPDYAQAEGWNRDLGPKRIHVKTKDGLEYDAGGRRVRKRTPAEEIVYIGDLYERVTNLATGEVEHRYFVRSDERVVAVVTRKGGQGGQASKTQFVHVDHLGSIDALTSVANGVGVVDERRSYDELGARRDVTWSVPVPASFAPETSLGFTGHEPDAELGLVNMKGRMYDPKLGRFLTPDPIVAHPHFGQSWNPYSYVLNSPLSKVDPSGFVVEVPGGWLPDAVYQTADGTTEFVYLFGDDIEWLTGLDDGPEVIGDPPKEGLIEPTEVGDTRPPADMTVAGVVGGWIGQPPATVDEWLKAVVIAQQLHNGAHRGLQELVLNTGKSLWLNFVTAGGYGVYSNGRAMYEGYKEDGALGALNAINPLYHLARGVEDTVDALERGDYEAVGAIGAPTAVLGAALGVGVGRALGAGGAAAQGAARGPAASLDLAQQVATCLGSTPSRPWCMRLERWDSRLQAV